MIKKIFISLFLLNTFVFAVDFNNDRFNHSIVFHFCNKNPPIDVIFDKNTKKTFYCKLSEIEKVSQVDINTINKVKNSKVDSFPYSKYNPFAVLKITKLFDDIDENGKLISKSVILIRDKNKKKLTYACNKREIKWSDLDDLVKAKREEKFLKSENSTDLKNLLPRELLSYIIYLMKEDAFVFYLVSKDWQQLLKNGLTKIRIDKGKVFLGWGAERIKIQVDLKLIKNFFPNITDFYICSNVPKNFEVLGSFTKLTSLELSWIRNENYEIFKNNEELKVLNLSGLTNLKRLEMHDVHDVAESELEKIGSLPNLEYLKVCFDADASSSLGFDIGKLKNLKKLCLESVKFNKETWAKLASLTKLNFLKISISGTWDDEDDDYSHFLDELDGIQNLSLLTSLNNFILDMDDPRLNEGASSIIDWSFLLSLTNLTNLKLTCMDDKMLLKFQEAFTNLKCLNIK